MGAILKGHCSRTGAKRELCFEKYPGVQQPDGRFMHGLGVVLKKEDGTRLAELRFSQKAFKELVSNLFREELTAAYHKTMRRLQGGAAPPRAPNGNGQPPSQPVDLAGLARVAIGVYDWLNGEPPIPK